jgi:hypothetical protein
VTSDRETALKFAAILWLVMLAAIAVLAVVLRIVHG